MKTRAWFPGQSVPPPTACPQLVVCQLLKSNHVLSTSHNWSKYLNGLECWKDTILLKQPANDLSNFETSKVNGTMIMNYCSVKPNHEEEILTSSRRFPESHKFRRKQQPKNSCGQASKIITFYFWYCCLQPLLFAAQLNGTTVFFFSVFIRHPSTKSECINMSVKTSTHQLHLVM